MATEPPSLPQSPPTSPGASAGGPTGPAQLELPRPLFDRLTVGKLIDHGRARHEFHSLGEMSYFVKILTDDGQRTIWGKGLERAIVKSRTQPQLGDLVGIRENNLDPVSFVLRTRNAEGLVTATRKTETPRPHWVVEKLADFDLRAAAARALRDPTISRREAVINHPDLAAAHYLLDTARKWASGRWQNPKTQESFVGALREMLAFAIERGHPIPERENAQIARVSDKARAERTR